MADTSWAFPTGISAGVGALASTFGISVEMSGLIGLSACGAIVATGDSPKTSSNIRAVAMWIVLATVPAFLSQAIGQLVGLKWPATGIISFCMAMYGWRLRLSVEAMIVEGVVGRVKQVLNIKAGPETDD
jgi:hypothetical protein